jgi:hypothetical protein
MQFLLGCGKSVQTCLHQLGASSTAKRASKHVGSGKQKTRLTG